MREVKMPHRLQAVLHIVWEYDAPDEWYQTSDLNEKIAIDLSNYKGDPFAFFPTKPNDDGTVTVNVTVEQA